MIGLLLSFFCLLTITQGDDRLTRTKAVTSIPATDMVTTLPNISTGKGSDYSKLEGWIYSKVNITESVAQREPFRLSSETSKNFAASVPIKAKAAEKQKLQDPSSWGRGIPVSSLLNQVEIENEENIKKTKIVLRLDKDYAPSEIAEYVHRTGDERGISQLFSDMIQEGEITQASRDDMLIFLEDVQRQLEKLRRHTFLP